MTDAPLLRKTPNALADRLTRLRNAGNAYLDYTIFLELGALLEKRSSTNVFTAIGTQRSQSLRGAHEQAGTIKHKGARNSAPSAQRTYTYEQTQTNNAPAERDEQNTNIVFAMVASRRTSYALGARSRQQHKHESHNTHLVFLRVHGKSFRQLRAVLCILGLRKRNRGR